MPDPLSQEEQARLVELAEAEAYVDLFQSAPRHLGFQVLHIQSASILIGTHLDIPLFNRVIGLGLLEPATEASVDWILEQFNQRGLCNFAFQLSPVAQPPKLAGWLEARQVKSRDNWSKVYRPANPAVEIFTDLHIERIGPQYAGEFSRVACAAFGMPDFLGPMLAAAVGRKGWYHYLAWDGRKPVASGALYVTGRLGWLGIGSTLPTHRRRGAQGALLARRIRDGIALGCEWLVTETGEDTPEHPNPSYHNMLRTGFQLAYQRPNFMLQR